MAEIVCCVHNPSFCNHKQDTSAWGSFDIIYDCYGTPTMPASLQVLHSSALGRELVETLNSTAMIILGREAVLEISSNFWDNPLQSDLPS